MLAEVNNNSPRQLAFPTPLSESENSPSQSTASSKKEYSDPIQKLCMEILLPELLKTGQPFMKFSRKENQQKYPFLENSLWIDRNGNIFEQYHSKNLSGIPNTEIRHKGFVGEGENKRIWALKPMYVTSDCPKVLRARFMRMSDGLRARLEAFLKFGKELDSKYLLIPEMIFSTNSKGKEVVYQMMPEGYRDLSRILKRLKPLAKLLVARDVGLGLIHMHDKKCPHLHVTPNNIMVMNDPGRSKSLDIKLIDFDMTMKLQEDSEYSCRIANYADPHSLVYTRKGLEPAKIHDQFGFGIVLCELLTGYSPRKNFMHAELRHWVREEDFIPQLEKSLLLELNEALELKLNESPDHTLTKALHTKVGNTLQVILKKARQAELIKILKLRLNKPLQSELNKALQAHATLQADLTKALIPKLDKSLLAELEEPLLELIKSFEINSYNLFQDDCTLQADLIADLKSKLNEPILAELNEPLRIKLNKALEFKAPEALQDVIRSCCIGPQENRPYRLPEFVEIIEKEIAILKREIAESNAKMKTKKVGNGSECV